MIGIIVALVAAFTPIDILGEMVSIGTLFAFVLVCSAVVYLRRSDAEVARPFRVPNVPWVPLVGIVFCLLLMVGLPLVTWMRLIIWLVIGLVVCSGYGSRHSRLRHA
jgi:basic amino acid/polyamine antiporter, APA family